MIFTILVPLDGSKKAEMILNIVKELSNHLRIKVILLHVITTTPPTGVEDTYLASLSHQIIYRARVEFAETYFISLHEELSGNNIKVLTMVTYGNVVDSIVHTAEQEDVNIIAMTRRRRNRILGFLRRNIAERVLRRLEKPILLIPS